MNVWRERYLPLRVTHPPVNRVRRLIARDSAELCYRHFGIYVFRRGVDPKLLQCRQASVNAFQFLVQPLRPNFPLVTPGAVKIASARRPFSRPRAIVAS